MVKQVFIIVLVFVLQVSSFSQNWIARKFPVSLMTAQYAGSTGFLSLGYSKVTVKNKLELGILFGNVPRSRGGAGNSFTLKSVYNPFQIEVEEKWMIEPLQTGIFVTRNFGENLSLQWSNKYPPGYYWWNASIRFHFSLGSQISYHFDSEHINRLAVYLEANTNDLYIYSYLPNRKTIRLVDIFFFGTGVKLYMK